MLQHNSNMQHCQRCLALCGEAFHVSSVSGTATERNRGIPEPWLEWSSGDPLFQPGGQGAPLRSGCSGLWLQHCQGQSLQDLSGQPVLGFDCCHGEESSPDVYLEVPPSSWCLVPPPHCPSPPRTAWSHLCILCPEPALRSPLCLLLLPKSHLSPVLPLSHSPAPALWTFSPLVSPKLDTVLQTQWEKRERLIFLALLAASSPGQPGMWLPCPPTSRIKLLCGSRA